MDPVQRMAAGAVLLERGLLKLVAMHLGGILAARQAGGQGEEAVDIVVRQDIGPGKANRLADRILRHEVVDRHRKVGDIVALDPEDRVLDPGKQDIRRFPGPVSPRQFQVRVASR